MKAGATGRDEPASRDGRDEPASRDERDKPGKPGKQATMSTRISIDRRQFLVRSGSVAVASLGFPSIVPASALGRSGRSAPSERITVGCVGMGGQGQGDMRGFLQQDDAHVVAVCDVDDLHRGRGLDIVNQRYGNKDCAGYGDFRELIARDDIDVVQITTPDHWHAPIAVAAAKAGKDMYGEKPFAHSLREGRAACDAIERYRCVWQTGSQMRSDLHNQFACELVRNGRIGRVRRVEVGLPGGVSEYELFNGASGQDVATPPERLDYDMWLGPAPYADYVPARVHWNWRWNLEYGGGLLMDWVGHLVDIAHWGLGLDRTGPVEIEGVGEYLTTGLYNTAPRYRIRTRYANGVEMVVAGDHDDIDGGVKWIGEDGWVSTWDFVEAHPRSLLRERIGPGEIRLPGVGDPVDRKGTSHTRNFLDCVRSRATTIAPSEVGHRSASVGHLGQIAMLLGRKIRFDPDTERIIDDDTATRMLGNAMRGPWTLN